MTPDERPTVVISCRVMQELLTPRLPAGMPVTYLDILLHNTPRKLAAALQEELDKVAQPSNVIIGYGLCGNGLVGVRAGPHTLIVPRTHDCVAIFLGSHQRYVQRFFANPNTYYLTRGWLEAHDDPLHDYLDYVRDYDQETADYLVEMKYRHYRRLCMVGFSQEELDLCRPMAMKVAEFCGQRWGMVYEEVTGSTGLLDSLMSMPNRLDSADSEFVVVRPGEVIEAEMFMRSGEAVPASSARKCAEA
ncbi:MAG: DUF1638 domain-containing protein [Hyphomicrobiaceae bacterium]|nr:DUF1638 domain-containing protein [Hyphomicrobiaceae bacterium]